MVYPGGGGLTYHQLLHLNLFISQSSHSLQNKRNLPLTLSCVTLIICRISPQEDCLTFVRLLTEPQRGSCIEKINRKTKL